MRRTSPLREAGLDAVTLVVLFLLLVPILWVFVASVRPETDITGGGLWPQRLTFVHYEAILAKKPFLIALKNSLIVGIVVAIITTALALPAAYALSRFRFHGRTFFGLLILGTQMLPSLAVLVPLVVIVRQLGLTNTLTALIFTHLDAQGLHRRHPEGARGSGDDRRLLAGRRADAHRHPADPARHHRGRHLRLRPLLG
jgi:ABC-type glycerol-3-phosphate transport system permease component